MKKYSFSVQGTHCASCKILIEDILVEHQEVSGATVDLHRRVVEVEGDITSSPEELVRALNPLLEPHRYQLSLEEVRQEKEYLSLAIALPIGLLVLFLFFLLQRSGLVNFGFEGGLTPWTALLIGIIASLSTCLAVVGGVILSLSARVSQDVSTFRPFALFHTGRLVGFALLGGLLGLFGEVLAISETISIALGFFAAVVMIILGLNLLDLFHVTKKLQLSLPTGFFQKITRIEEGCFVPVFLGAATFFLPCGFTQSMQIASLASGSWLQGSMIMLMFALGTLPMLFLISFSSYRFAHSPYAPIFFKASGIVVIGFGVFAFLSGLVGLGIISPFFGI